MEFVADVEEYAARRKPRAQRLEDSLIRSVKVALHRHPTKAWADSLIRRGEREIRAVYRSESGKASARGSGLDRELADFRSRFQEMLDKTEPDEDREDEQARAIAASMAALILSTGTLAAALDSEVEDLQKVWIDMDDSSVRASHRGVEAVPLGEKFQVAGVEMDRPGDMRAPIELWINCRCILGVQSLNAGRIAASLNEGIEMTDTAVAEAPEDLDADLDSGVEEDLTVYWHGALAPEGLVSGDKRRFVANALTWRNLPLPFSWQKVNAPGHDGSVVIGSIDTLERRETEDGTPVLWATGHFLQTPEADEYIQLRADGAVRGVSVDVDSAAIQFSDLEGNAVAGDSLTEDSIQDIIAGRICGATACPIQAFMEAEVFLGHEEGSISLVAAGDCLPCQFKAGIDEGSWDGSASNYTDQEWFDATIIHLGEGDDRLLKSNNKVPIYTPGGKLSRAGVHAAAGRLNQTDAPPAKISAAKATLRGAYDVLGEDPPDSLKAAEADVLEFGEFGEFVKTEDGPGWLTHPVDTQRLRRYWTKGKGALKIRWGVPGDFNRCRQHLAKYVKPQYLNGYCANRHYDATGFWPGRAPSERGFATGPAFTLVASAEAPSKPPHEWFENPNLIGHSPIVVTEEGQVFGHIAEWDQCHIGFGEKAGQCVLAPRSMTNYAYFTTGAVLTDQGMVPTGPLTMDTGHCNDPYASAQVAAAHYDNTGTAVADVAVGEDEYGIWCAGMVRPGTPAEKVHALRASVASGDWRSIRGNLEMVAALIVNTGGFPIPRTQLAASGGQQVSLVAAGIVRREYDEWKDPDIFDVEKFASLVEAITSTMEDRATRRSRMKELRAASGRDPKVRMAALAASRGGE